MSVLEPRIAELQKTLKRVFVDSVMLQAVKEDTYGCSQAIGNNTRHAGSARVHPASWGSSQICATTSRRGGHRRSRHHQCRPLGAVATAWCTRGHVSGGDLRHDGDRPLVVLPFARDPSAFPV